MSETSPHAATGAKDVRNLSNKMADKQIRRHLRDGRTDEIKEIIQQMTSDFLAGKTRDPLLCVAAQKGNEEVVHCLLERGADVNAADRHGLNALHIAAKEGLINIIELMLLNSADVQALSLGGDSALSLAVQQNQHQAVEKLIEHGANVHHTSSFINNGGTALHAAAILPTSQIVNMLLETDVNIDAQNGDGRTALHLAALKGCTKNVQRLLKCGANPNLLDSDGQSPLLVAADGSNVEIIRQLCIAGAWINIVNASSHSALRKAVAQRNINIVRTLLHFGAKVNREFVAGETCLKLSISECSHKMVKKWGGKGWIRSVRVDINIEIEMLDTLIAAGADLSQVDAQGNSCLHVCVKTGCAAVLKYLLNNGANCLLVNGAEQTVLQYACIHNTTQAIAILIRNCASLVNNHHNARGDTGDPNNGVADLDLSSPLIVLWLKRNKQCLHLLCEAGYRSTEEERTYVEMTTRPNNKKVDGTIGNYLRREFTNPWSLMRITRTVIRDQLQVGIEHKVAELPIPQALRESICLTGR